MQTHKSTPRNLFKTTGLMVTPLVLVLMSVVFLRSQPVAQAKNLPTRLPENTPTLALTVSSASKPIPPGDVPLASFESISVNGVTVYAGNYRLQDGQLLADVCFDMLDDSDWTIWGEVPVANVRGSSLDLMSMTLIEIRHAPKLVDGKMKQNIITGSNDIYRDAKAGQKLGQRCDTIGYDLTKAFDTSHFILTIQNIARNPSELDTCQSDTEYLKKMQNALDKKKTGIKIKNRSESGSCGIEIIEKPANMSDVTARSLVSDQEMFIDTFGIRGPWVFEGGIK